MQTIRSPDHESRLYPVVFSVFKRHYVPCAGCGRPVPPGNRFTCCTGCLGFYCERCVLDGTFEDHECMDEEIMF